MVHEHLSLPENATRFTKFLSQFDCFLDLTSEMYKKYQLGFHYVQTDNSMVVYNNAASIKNLNTVDIIDLATDHRHPGPKTHRAWADIIIEFLDDKIKLMTIY